MPNAKVMNSAADAWVASAAYHSSASSLACGLNRQAVPRGGNGAASGSFSGASAAFSTDGAGLAAIRFQHARYLAATGLLSTTCTTFDWPYTPPLEKLVEPV